MCIKQIKKLFFKDLKKMIEIKQMDGSYFQTNENIMVLNICIVNLTNQVLRDLHFSMTQGTLLPKYSTMNTLSNDSFAGMTLSGEYNSISHPFILEADNRIEGYVIVEFTNPPISFNLNVCDESNAVIGGFEVDMQNIKRISYNANN